MIDPLKLAMSRIYNSIPMEILEATFQPYEYNESLDELIKQKVLLDRVRDEISIRGGKVMKIILDLNWCKYTSSPSRFALGISGSSSVFVIPPEAREHRDISAILGVKFPYSISTSTSGTFYNSCQNRGNTLSALACEALNNQTKANQLAAPIGILKPNNTIVLYPPQISHIPWQITVRLRYDDNFSDMDVSSLNTFEQICEMATKAYIYTNMIFKVETNLVFRGMELGIFKDLVNSYADANEKLEELYLMLGGNEFYDPERLIGILQRIVPKS